MSEQRLGEMASDRPCGKCGFNLHGQPIVREPHYGLIMARCPECAQVAALDEYPSLGRWAGRLAGLLAIAWLGVLLLGAIGTGVWAYQLSRQTAIDILHPGVIALGTEYREWAAEQAAINPASPAQQNLQWFQSYPVETWPMVGPDYIATPEFEAFITGLRGDSLRDWSRARSAGLAALWMLLAGAAWAVVAPHLRRRGLLILAAAILLIACAAWGIDLVRGNAAQVWGSFNWAPDLVFHRYGAPVMPIGLTAAAIALYGGMLIGRPIARGLIRLLLPPRLRAPFGALWTLQGLDVPRSTPRHAPRTGQ